MVYMITYDLNKSGQEYEKVIEAIKSASTGVWCTYWKSSYLIQSNLTSANAVVEKIAPFIDGNDMLIAIEVTRNYQGMLPKDAWDYIRNMF